MNEMNIGGLNNLSGGGPMPSGIPLMNNIAPKSRPPMPLNNDQRSQLNTYIYEYFLRNSMYDCAKALLESGQPLNVIKDSPGRRRDDNSNNEEGNDESKIDFEMKRSIDLPEPNLPKECPESCFLYEWWCLFWDMFNAQRGKADGRNVIQYFTHTQALSRSRQEQQQMMYRGLRNDLTYPQGFNNMMRNQANSGVIMNPQNELRHKVLQNNRNPTPAQLHMLQQQKQQQMQMQRDPSGGENQQRPQSPASTDNAPSPSKRPRLDGAGFSSQVQLQNGRGQGGGLPQQVGNIVKQSGLTNHQFQNVSGNQNVAAQRLYQASLVQQQQSQMPTVKALPTSGVAQNRGSPMMTQNQQENGGVANYYNHADIGQNVIRGGPGQPGQPGAPGNHALQDYQMQLMLLEQQNKKRLQMARHEQDQMMPRPEGNQVPPVSGPNGQNFPGTSPQTNRSTNSPNVSDQIKRTHHMNPAGMPSPLSESQSRSSPSGNINFGLTGAPIDPSMNPQYFNKVNGMEASIVGGLPNSMRPPSSHPNNFNQMSQQTQIALAARQQHLQTQAQQQAQQQAQHQAQQQAQQQAHQQAQQQAHQVQQQAQQQAQQHAQQQHPQQQAQQQNWPPGPSAQPMMTQPSQGPAGPQQTIGTPQQRSMPPPSMPPGNISTNPNGRTPQATTSPSQTPAPPTPQQSNKANPKKKPDLKDKSKKKGSAANLNAGATPSADAEPTGATPTPATPMTPVHKQSFNNGQNGAVQAATNGQPPAPAGNIGISQQPDPLQGGGFGLGDSTFSNYDTSLDFANPGNGNIDGLQDFDFDSFLHQDAGDAVNDFTFDPSGFLDSNEIGAE